MTRLWRLLFTCIALLLPATTSTGQTPADAPVQPTPQSVRPNIVLILIDDMGYGDLSCYDPQAVPTPNIDRMAKEGIRFTQYYSSSPICSPSRAALLTGQYPQRCKITSYLDLRAINERRGVASWLDVAAPSLARELQKAGYATGHFGKWHLGGGRDVGDAPLITEYGFHESLTQFEGLGDRLMGYFDKHDGSAPERSGLCLASEKLGRGKIEWVDRSTLTTRYAARATAFMDAAQQQGKPFYVNVWLDDVHSPFFPPHRTREQKRSLYRDVVRATDAQLAPMLDHIRSTPALRDNTLVVIASDNGPEQGAGTAGPFRGHKANLYEGGVREPFIVWGPGLVAAGAAGTTNHVSVIAGMDFAPSVMELTGAAPPPGLRFDGRSVAGTLLGREKVVRETPIFWRRPPDRPGPAANPFPDLSIREGNWKLLCMTDGSSPQLYDLSSDVAEAKNRATDQPHRVKAMTDAVRAWNATMPADNPDKPK